jgi:DNA primase
MTVIPHSIIEDLKYRSEICDVISSYVTLKRAGNNMNGLCPFHSERTPSFTVFPATQSFYCFGCGAGGDVISFIMRTENLDYRAALELLAKRAGITLPDDEIREEGGVSRKRILEMNVCAARFFRDMLYDERIGAEARAYVEARQLRSSIVRRFGLGYAPDSFGALYDHLRKNGYTNEEMTTGFLCAVSKTGKLYDIFRGRLIIPIIDVTGNIVAFGGRLIGEGKAAPDGRKPPKYLNSSDTPAFKKMRNLFALNFAKAKSSERLILCEGYMDVIQLHAAGFENAVATLGTAITPEHARIMKKYTSNVVLAYDSDSAGQNATSKALRILNDAGVDAKVIRMDGAKDPDEYIKKFGAKKFAALMNESRSRFEYDLENVLKEYSLDDPEGKIKAADTICQKIASVYSSVERDVYISRAAKVLSLDPTSIKNDVERIIKRRQKAARAARPGELYRAGMGISDRVNPDFSKVPKASRFEETILGLIMLRREYIRREVDGFSVSEEDMPTGLGKRLLSAILEGEDSGGFGFEMLNESFTQDEVSRAEKMRVDRMKLSDNGPDVFDGTLRALREENEKNRNKDDGDFLYFIRKKRGEASPDQQ